MHTEETSMSQCTVLIDDFSQFGGLTAFEFLIIIFIFIIRSLIPDLAATECIFNNAGNCVEPHNVQQLQNDQESDYNIVDGKQFKRNRDQARLINQFWVVD